MGAGRRLDGLLLGYRSEASYHGSLASAPLRALLWAGGDAYRQGSTIRYHTLTYVYNGSARDELMGANIAAVQACEAAAPRETAPAGP